MGQAGRDLGPTLSWPDGDTGLRRDVLRRGIATARPTLAAYLLMHGLAGPLQASAVGFASVILTQLAQTLDTGRVEGTLSRSVAAAVAASVAMLLGTLWVRPIRRFLGLTNPNLTGWGLVGGSSVAALALSKLIEVGWHQGALMPISGRKSQRGRAAVVVCGLIDYNH